MVLSCNNWQNKKGTAERNCLGGAWKNHWLYITSKPWPSTCSVRGCTASPTLGAHVFHANVEGERIVPMCDACNKKSVEFSLKDGISIPPANRTSCPK